MGSDSSFSRDLPIRVASCEIQQLAVVELGSENYRCDLVVLDKSLQPVSILGNGVDWRQAIEAAVVQLCTSEYLVTDFEQQERESGQRFVRVIVQSRSKSAVSGTGCGLSDSCFSAYLTALLRAVAHAGLLNKSYRANNQKVLREWTREVVEDLVELGPQLDLNEGKTRLATEALILEHSNRVASAAIVTAANSPKPKTILSLFDTSAWLFDSQGQRRTSYLDTELWLAWYPGIENGDMTVDEVIATMPAAPDAAIPWIVKLFENPNGILRFRGAISLDDHDVMHVLLGRGLQDQDEAFVLGFAMGTAKRITRFETFCFRWILSRLYPEPYRIPTFLHPAFDLGVQCGKETGNKNLYREGLARLRSLTLAEARREAGIDVDIVRRYYELEQQQIPFTIASLRLP